jgi:anti-sigma regulatory factor (Ser/Thr protein kinase)
MFHESGSSTATMDPPHRTRPHPLGPGRRTRPARRTLHREELTLPATHASVPAARHRVGTALSRYGLPRELADTALLILTELVTNAVVHAAELSPEVDISVAVGGQELVIAVHDRHPEPPRVLPVCRPDGGGWGLKMVTDLTEQSGGRVDVPPDPDRHGKTVRVTLPHP